MRTLKLGASSTNCAAIDKMTKRFDGDNRRGVGEMRPTKKRAKPAKKSTEPKPRYYDDKTVLDFAGVGGCDGCARGKVPINKRGLADINGGTVSSGFAHTTKVRGKYSPCLESEMWSQLSKRFGR